MIKSLLVILAVIAVLYLIRSIRRLPDKERPKHALKYGLYILAAILIGLVVAGKLHWVAAGIAALLPIMQKLFHAGIRLMPFLKYWNEAKQQHNNTQQSPPPSTTGNMTLDEAKEIFGIETIDSVEQITKRHRELMQKIHPDRGGSDYLAAQINHAKDLLVGHIKKA